MVGKTSLKEVKDFRKEMFDRSMAIIERKGHDYNRKQQNDGDTLFNLRVSELLGVVPTAEHGILVRLSDKIMRLCSLVDAKPEDTQESFEDTIVDVHNYVDYLGLMRRNRMK